MLVERLQLCRLQHRAASVPAQAAATGAPPPAVAAGQASPASVIPRYLVFLRAFLSDAVYIPSAIVLVPRSVNAVLCMQSASARVAQAALAQHCFYVQPVGGWWRVEVCPGARVRQYHASAAGAVETVIELGTFDAQACQALGSLYVGTSACAAISD